MKPVNLSELNERITIQASTKTPDGMGSFAITWVDIATVWAKSWSVSSDEKNQDRQIVLERVQKFAIRYRGGLRSSWRIKWKREAVRYFNIIGIDSDKKVGFIYLTCKEAS